MLFRKEKPQEEQLVDLPTTAEELSTFMEEIIHNFKLPGNNDTRDSICTLIMHMPQSVSKAPQSYFASSVKKSMANKAAYDKLMEYKELRRQEAEAKQTAQGVPTSSH